MQVVIHAGMHKTGTSSLQAVLARHRETLAQHKIHYPDAGRKQHAPLLNVKSAKWHEDLCREHLQRARDSGASMLLFSAEAVSALDSAQLQRLADCFRGEHLRIVVCLRHWNGFLPSRWAQYCKRRDTQTIDGYLAALKSFGSHVDFRFDLVLERFAAVAEITAVSYDRSTAAENDVVPSLLRAIGIEKALPRIAASHVVRKNVRDDWRHIELSRLLNGLIADRCQLPQDDLCCAQGEHRTCGTKFELMGRIKKLSPHLLKKCEAVLDAHKVTKIVGHVDGAERIEAALADRFGKYFAEVADGEIFPAGVKAEFASTELTWDVFSNRYAKLVTKVLKRLKWRDAKRKARMGMPM